MPASPGPYTFTVDDDSSVAIWDHNGDLIARVFYGHGRTLATARLLAAAWEMRELAAQLIARLSLMEAAHGHGLPSNFEYNRGKANDIASQLRDLITSIAIGD